MHSPSPKQSPPLSPPPPPPPSIFSLSSPTLPLSLKSETPPLPTMANPGIDAGSSWATSFGVGGDEDTPSSAFHLNSFVDFHHHYEEATKIRIANMNPATSGTLIDGNSDFNANGQACQHSDHHHHHDNDIRSPSSADLNKLDAFLWDVPLISPPPSAVSAAFAAASCGSFETNQFLQDPTNSNEIGEFDMNGSFGPLVESSLVQTLADAVNTKLKEEDSLPIISDNNNTAAITIATKKRSVPVLPRTPPPPIAISPSNATVVTPSTDVAAAASSSTSKKTSRTPDFVFDPTRTWQTVFADRSFLGPDGDVQVFAKTRCDKPCLSVPDRLFSSMKYEIKQRAFGQFVTGIPFLMSRISVVEPETGIEVRLDGHSAIKDPIDAALVTPTLKKKKPQQQSLSSPTVPTLEGSLRAQFQNISSHSDHKLYCWQIDYFTPSDHDNPILTKRSPPFKVFARKPGKIAPSSTNRKRKRASVDDSSTTPEDDVDDESFEQGDDASLSSTSAPNPKTKKAKLVAPPSQESVAQTAAATPVDVNSIFEKCQDKLNELVQIRNQMTEAERKYCRDLLISKLRAIDPQFVDSLVSSDFPPPPIHNPQQHHFPSFLGITIVSPHLSLSPSTSSPSFTF